MWPANNGFPTNGQYQQNNFNQDDLSATTPLASPFTGGAPGPNLFLQPNMMQMQYDEMNIDGCNGFPPDVPMFNQAAFAQNQFIAPNPPFSPQLLISTNNSAPPATPTPTKEQLAVKTAELRARLMKGKQGRANSATPPVSAPAKQITALEPSSSLQQSPNSPAIGSSETDEHLRREKEINDLISDYSDTKPATKLKMNHGAENDMAKKQTHINTSILSAKSPGVFSGSPTRITKSHANNCRASNGIPTEGETKKVENGSMSEGEILDEPIPKKLPPTEPKGNQINTKSANVNEKSLESEDDRTARSPYTRVKLEEPGPLVRRPAPVQPSRPDPPRFREERREESDFRPERKSNSDHRHEKKSHQHHPHRFSRDQNDDYRRLEVAKEEAKSVRESKPPTLAQVLPHDTDLREWLEMTHYHDASHRNKVLKTARALKELEEQKAKILAGIQDDQSLVKYNMGSLMTGLIMQPQNAPATTEPADLRDRVTSNKRNYSEVQDPPEEANYGKAARLEDRDHEYRRRQSSVDYDSSRRSNGDRGGRSHFEESRNRGRSRSIDREVSPGSRAYESRPHARERSYDAGSGGRRSFEVHGGYRGKAFDPNYRGRGRGRGRGDWVSHESRSEAGFGPRNALGKPYKDSKGFDRGGKGDTRYFIVKSYNEENVLRCIEDGVWTTQAQNGPIFKEAYQTCKNVILVFSINKSRAFQGYARMESLPGAVEVPLWQNSINWESTGAFQVRWLAICSTRFHRVGHLKNSLNENVPVLVGKDGQEIDEECGRGLLECMDEELELALEGEKSMNPEDFWDD
ncbi:hypothetical protein DSL72_007542 [Monilinia vaccinii-corymbosi]|uniref:YTH domain-containing protein n=1 Tax=Monilinia vaccinii-corymbosi TaxID=61207 RepID=A0A8A3PH96_9HELO|nr:hypothetical protein DSL72_007542 [Monilinia vaccinii-corymbosi]